ncbi:MAG: sensor domain-containing diguanylate cyclase [Erysipelotrichaceae bacterium]|nr:sensor domain-containing diguanylate cyclase [Erysipelotrichaceae bacterium]
MNLNPIEYQIIVESSPNMIWRAGTDALCNYFNATWLKFTGKTMNEEIGNGWATGVHPEDFERCLKIYLDNFATQTDFEMEYRLKRHDGIYRWIYDRGAAVFSDKNVFEGYIGSCVDVTDKIEGQLMRDLAQKDGLTGIYNRQHFERLGTTEFLRAKRFNTYLTLVMIDMDDFKNINDTYGHIAGDFVLKEVALFLSKQIRDFDVLARFGGDEFVILMPNTKQSEAQTMVDRVDNTLSELKILFEKDLISISASFGITQLNEEEKFEKVLVAADKRLYEKKRNRSLKQSSEI